MGILRRISSQVLFAYEVNSSSPSPIYSSLSSPMSSVPADRFCGAVKKSVSSVWCPMWPFGVSGMSFRCVILFVGLFSAHTVVFASRTDLSDAEASLSMDPRSSRLSSLRCLRVLAARGGVFRELNVSEGWVLVYK